MDGREDGREEKETEEEQKKRINRGRGGKEAAVGDKNKKDDRGSGGEERNKLTSMCRLCVSSTRSRRISVIRSV